jgi:hypothetical protein
MSSDHNIPPISSISKPTPFEKQGVFLNVPFDKKYQPLFIAIIAALVSIGYHPRCVLEIAETGQGRLTRIRKHLERCRTSIHDLSRVSLPPRFNMPFELGLAYSIMFYVKQPLNYKIIIMESENHRLSRTLSDMAGYDPYIHHSKPLTIISSILNALGKTRAKPSPKEIYTIWRKLMRVSRKLIITHGEDGIYSRVLFRRVVAVAALLAEKEGFIILKK